MEELESLRAALARAEVAALVADAEDVTDWQRGYRACSERVQRALELAPRCVCGDPDGEYPGWQHSRSCPVGG